MSHAKAIGADPNLVLARFAAERLLFRLSASPYAERFVLGTGMYLEASGQAGPCVTIWAVGVKVRERVLIGGVEVDLS